VEFIGFIVSLVYIIFIITIVSYLGKIASYLKSISESLEGLRLHLGNIKEIMRRDQLMRKLSEGEEKR
jgi:hypothetical protein